MTPKQKAFVEEYLIDLNATQAAIRAGYSKKTANEQASRLLANVNIAKAVEEAKSMRSDKTKIDAEYVLKQAVKLHERCMQEVKPKTDRKGDPIVDDDGAPVFEFNAAGASKALELVGKHVGVQAFREKIGIEGGDGGPISTIQRIIIDPKADDAAS